MVESTTGKNALKDALGEDAYRIVGQVSEAGAAVTVIAGLSNPDYYVKNNQVAHFEQVPRVGEGGLDVLHIPRDAEGNPIPLNKQTVNGQDIPLPDPAAEGRPHTVLGGKVSSETGEVYRQSATFPGGTWPTVNGQDVPWSEVHWTDHGTPYHHTNPHQHIFEYNPDKGGWIRKGPTIFEP